MASVVLEASRQTVNVLCSLALAFCFIYLYYDYLQTVSNTEIVHIEELNRPVPVQGKMLLNNDTAPAHPEFVVLNPYN